MRDIAVMNERVFNLELALDNYVSTFGGEIFAVNERVSNLGGTLYSFMNTMKTHAIFDSTFNG